MIHEIVNFIEHLENSSPKIFSENLELKQGLYFMLEKEDGKLVVKDENILHVNSKTEENGLYKQFLELYIRTEMLNAMKSFNSGPKIYIAIGSPFAISISGLGLKKAEAKRLDAMEAYFKASIKYMDVKNKQHNKWLTEFKKFAEHDMFEIILQNKILPNPKKTDTFFFFMSEPSLKDYEENHSRFLSQKLFNKDKFNIETKDGELLGISDNLSGFNDGKEFLKHKTSPFELNYRVNGKDAMRLHKFFRLQQKNKVIPNPFPLFIDKNELNKEVVKFYGEDKKRGHREIVEHLLDKKKADLDNYYLIYFHNGEKGSRIIDIDFVSRYKYDTQDVPIIKALFNYKTKKKEFGLRDFSIQNIFDFQSRIFNTVFNKQLLQDTKNGLWIKYFDDIEEKPEYGATSIIVNLFYKYRKSMYDYVYKSRRDAISSVMFNDIMINSILDDIHRDKEYDKSIRIKDKLNIWFSLYNYFNHNIKRDNMVLKIEKHRMMVKEVAEGTLNVSNDEEFAFVAGQVIYYLLSKSRSANKSHALLEPFLQKSKYSEFRKVLKNTFNTYKHENFSARFSNPFANVMDYDFKGDLKELSPIILAGYFSDCSLYAEKQDDDSINITVNK